MFAHVSFGVRDVDTGRAFYDAALAPLGYRCIRAARSMVGYGYGTDTISFWVVSDPETRLFRPRQLYAGPVERSPAPIAERKAHAPLVG